MMLTSTLKVLQLLWSFATLWMVFNNIMAAKGSTCGPPTPPYGSVIIHPSVQGQHKNGSLVLFGCKQGFYLVGPPLIKCTGNTWTKIKFRCIGFCPDFRHILNGQVLHVSPKVGKAAVEFRCNEKYRLIGRTRLECVNGRWNAELPFCKKLKSCERLRAPANGTLYGDDIAHGAKVSFTCLTGFELFGLQTITCDNGAWSGSVPSCKAYCMRIRAPSNGRKHGVLFSHGSMVSFECKTGYNLVGDRVLWCLNGKWNSTVPVCNVMLCPRPVIPSNSYIIHPRANQDSYFHGTKLFLACLDGHYLIGSPIMDCNQTEWINMDFSCIASCPVLGSIKNGIITPVTLKGGGEVKIKCHTNHTLVGSPRLICENGRWNDSLPTCGAPCDEPAIPAHGWKSNLDYRHGRSVKFYCSGKYDRIGAFSITCNDGTWDNQVPVCKARCSDPGSPSHGRRRGDIFRHNSWVQFLCDANYQLEGDQWIQCVDGSWSGPLPKCIAPCSDPGIPYQGNRIGQDFRHDRTVRFTCPRDYVMEGVSEIRCSDGKWSNNKPSCKTPCEEATNPTNGWKWGDSRHGSSVRFACSRGYQRVGVVSITCNDGIWDNQAPVCKGVCGRPRYPIKGRLQGSSFLDGDEVTFSCERNYDLFGEAKLLCVGRSWNSPIPECKARCRFMGRPEHGFYLKGARRAGDMIRHGERISYRCFNGYTLIGANMQECDNGRWTNDRPACKAFCPDPGVPAHGRRLGDDFRDGQKVTFECDNNYDLFGNNTVQCNGGVWSGNRPECKGRCTFGGSPESGYTVRRTLFRGARLKHGNGVQFACKATYILVGSSSLHCDNGNWNGSVPVCKASCDDPGFIKHGRRTGSDFSHGQFVTYKCKEGYSLEGNNQLKCENGEWDSERPQCKDCGRPLGMENSNIPDAWIRSPYGISRPKFARLNGDSAWCITRQTFLQIDLRRTYKLTAIATQGGAGLNRWVERYKVSFNIGSIRVMYSESGSQKFIEGNKDASSIVKYWFNEPFATKAVRIYPVVGASTVCLRAEIYGCDPRPDCILVGSSFWGLWTHRDNSYNYYQAFITKLNDTHLDFALKFNSRLTRSYKRTDPVLIIDKIPEIKDITVNSQVIAVHRPRTPEWYRVGKVTHTSRTSVHVTFHDGQRRWVRQRQLRLVKKPRFCNDGLK